MNFEEINKLIEEARLIIEEEFIWFAYDHDKPAGLMAAFPDINEVLRKLHNGRLTTINKLRFLYYRKRAISRVRVFIFGILPEYQNTGMVAALFYQLVKVLNKKPRYKEIELSWIGDYNSRMINIYSKFGGKLVKKHITYMYLIDPEVEFRRFNNKFEGKLYN